MKKNVASRQPAWCTRFYETWCAGAPPGIRMFNAWGSEVKEINVTLVNLFVRYVVVEDEEAESWVREILEHVGNLTQKHNGVFVRKGEGWTYKSRSQVLEEVGNDFGEGELAEELRKGYKYKDAPRT